MPVPSVIGDLSTTASSNSPQGTDSAKGVVDDFFRAHASFIAKLRDEKANLSGATYTGDVVVPSLNGGPLAGTRNRLINGNFTVNQLGLSGTVTLAAGAYGHDGWKAGASGCTYTFTTSGADTIITITAGSLMQVVEDIFVEGGIYTLSHKGTAQGRIGINGATPSGSYAATPIASASATGKQTITVEFSTGTVDRVMLEPGSQASPFERRPNEFQLCQRYYEPVTLGGNARLFRWYGPGGSAEIRTPFAWQVQKRTTPTIVNAVPDYSSNCSASIGDVTPYGYNVTMLSSAAGVGSFGWLTTTMAASARL